MKFEKVVFFGDCLDNRYHKRIREFMAEGYEVELYTFTYRDDDVRRYGDSYPIHQLKHFSEPPSYLTRLLEFTTAFRKIIYEYDRSKTLFYFFTLNTSITALTCPGLVYVYEESDMLFDRMGNNLMKGLVRGINKKVIRKSKLTVFTSEGFATYYYGNNVPKQITIIPNKVSVECLELRHLNRRTIDYTHLRFAFVGGIRYDALFSFAKIVASNFPNHEFHFYGAIIGFTPMQVKELEAYPNISFHGRFSAPKDYPEIYESIDFVVSTYDTLELNPKYAEPNKLYESIFFEIPIIVSSNSFLAEKVNRLGTGFDVNPYDEEDIVRKILMINNDTYSNYIKAIQAIPKETIINSNKAFFEKINNL